MSACALPRRSCAASSGERTCELTNAPLISSDNWPPELVGALDAEPRCDALEAATQLTLVRCCDLARRVIAVGELGRDVELGTSAVVRAPDALADPVEPSTFIRRRSSGSR